MCQEPMVVALAAFEGGPRLVLPAPRKGPPQTKEGPADQARRPGPFPAEAPGEELVADLRSRLTPAQMVQEKLVALLQRSAFPISHVVALHGVGRRRPVVAVD